LGHTGKNKLSVVECRTFWGEPERVHVQNMEQLHAHDRYQNVTEHKTSGHSIWNKIYRHAQYRKWVRHGPAGMSCPVCMVAACTWVQQTMCFAGHVYTEVALSQSFMTCDSPHRCGHWRSRSMWQV